MVLNPRFSGSNTFFCRTYKNKYKLRLKGTGAHAVPPKRSRPGVSDRENELENGNLLNAISGIVGKLDGIFTEFHIISTDDAIFAPFLSEFPDNWTGIKCDLLNSSNLAFKFQKAIAFAKACEVVHSTNPSVGNAIPLSETSFENFKEYAKQAFHCSREIVKILIFDFLYHCLVRKGPALEQLADPEFTVSNFFKYTAESGAVPQTKVESLSEAIAEHTYKPPKQEFYLFNEPRYSNVFNEIEFCSHDFVNVDSSDDEKQFYFRAVGYAFWNNLASIAPGNDKLTEDIAKEINSRNNIWKDLITTGRQDSFKTAAIELSESLNKYLRLKTVLCWVYNIKPMLNGSNSEFAKKCLLDAKYRVREKKTIERFNKDFLANKESIHEAYKMVTPPNIVGFATTTVPNAGQDRSPKKQRQFEIKMFKKECIFKLLKKNIDGQIDESLQTLLKEAYERNERNEFQQSLLQGLMEMSDDDSSGSGEPNSSGSSSSDKIMAEENRLLEEALAS
jgi:hypothetical protein